ncbi:YkgJ family cysteine cluster protein [Candidatus Bathyarchaeota archaeon]|nr:MAG: YkgJ family cysteine cluster protein [Candidatus Bathyarchaeota archaeon]
MRCSHCGKCCENTEMPLSEADIKRLEKAGFHREDFVQYDSRGYARLQNREGYCVFYDKKRRRCRVYKYRPLGCRIYPIIFSEDEGIIVDDLCPMKDTVSKSEVKKKGMLLVRLLRKLDEEAESRLLRTEQR